MSDYGHSDGRYAPMGNTSSVIDGDAVSRAQSVASQKMESRFSSRYRNFCPQTRADMLLHLCPPIPHSPMVASGFSTRY